MELKNFGNKLILARKEKGLSQEQLAARIGVTPQAVSKWERGNSFPDLDLLVGLCDVLECSSDYLLSRDTHKARLSEDMNEKTVERLLGRTLAEPIVIDVGMELIDLLTPEYQNQFPSIRSLREKLATEYGFLLPIVRIKDCPDISELSYRISVFDTVLYSQTMQETDDITFLSMCEELETVIRHNFDRIINRQMVQDLVDHLAVNYPAAIKGVVPDKISLMKLQAVLTGLLQQGKPIRKLLKILEIIEEENAPVTEELVEIIIKRLN